MLRARWCLEVEALNCVASAVFARGGAPARTITIGSTANILTATVQWSPPARTGTIAGTPVSSVSRVNGTHRVRTSSLCKGISMIAGLIRQQRTKSVSAGATFWLVGTTHHQKALT